MTAVVTSSGAAEDTARATRNIANARKAGSSGSGNAQSAGLNFSSLLTSDDPLLSEENKGTAQPPTDGTTSDQQAATEAAQASLMSLLSWQNYQSGGKDAATTESALQETLKGTSSLRSATSAAQSSTKGAGLDSTNGSGAVIDVPLADESGTGLVTKGTLEAAVSGSTPPKGLESQVKDDTLAQARSALMDPSTEVASSASESAATHPSNTVTMADMGVTLNTTLRKGSGLRPLVTATSNNIGKDEQAQSASTGSTVSSIQSNSDSSGIRTTMDLARSQTSSEQPTPERDAQPGGGEQSNSVESPFGTTVVEHPQHVEMQQVAHPEHAQTLNSAELPPDNMQGMLRDAMDQLGAQVAYWASNGTQSASLTIGDAATSGALEVKVSLSDGEVNVEFMSKEHELRNAIADNARDMLQTMLDGQGIALGQVSVGSGQADAQSSFSQEQRQGSLSASANGPATISQTAASSTTNHRMPDKRSSIISADKLDFFA
jgi:hypothetical protein